MIAGVLGQKQWQFDVYSKDVELANKMESGGLPGRVHISKDTVEFLNGEFELEDGNGSSREETIRSLGIKTYLIVKVLKPYPEGTLDNNIEKQTENNLDSNQINNTAEQQKLLQDVANLAQTGNDTNNNNSNNSTNNDSKRKVSNAIARTSITGQHTSTVVAEAAYSTATSRSSINQLDNQSMDEYQRRLRYELLNRDNGEMVQRIRPFTFSFSDKDYERQYMNNSDETAGVSLTGLPITALLIAFTEFTLGVNSSFSFIILLLSGLVQSFLALLSTLSGWAMRRYSYTNENSFEKDSLDLDAFDQQKKPSNEQISMLEMKAVSVNEKSPLKNGDHTLNNNNNNNLKLSVNASPSHTKSRQLSRYSSASHKSIFNKYRLSDERISSTKLACPGNCFQFH